MLQANDGSKYVAVPCVGAGAGNEVGIAAQKFTRRRILLIHLGQASISLERGREKSERESARQKKSNKCAETQNHREKREERRQED